MRDTERKKKEQLFCFFLLSLRIFLVGMCVILCTAVYIPGSQPSQWRIRLVRPGVTVQSHYTVKKTAQNSSSERIWA